jgi:hypothetical protein
VIFLIWRGFICAEVVSMMLVMRRYGRSAAAVTAAEGKDYWSAMAILQCASM